MPKRQYDVLTHDGDRYRVTVESRTATETEYRYELTEVAPDIETFVGGVRDQYQFELAGLSDAEREVVEGAIGGGYFEDDDAFRSVVARIRDHEGIDVTDAYGTWLVEYENTAYVTYVEWYLSAGESATARGATRRAARSRNVTRNAGTGI